MIRRLVLRGWKAFDYIEFEPGPGVTFVTARNGVGKSSLLQGLAWSVFGERSGVDASRMIRAGHSSASTTVDLDIPDGQVLTIHRDVGGAAVGKVDGAEVPDLDAALRSIMGANLDFVARAVALSQQTLAEHTSSFDHLEEHLAEVFGIAALREAADQMAVEHARIKAANAKLRTSSKKGSGDLDALQARAGELREEVSELERRLTDLEPRHVAAQAAQAAAQEQVRLVSAHTAWAVSYSDLRTRAEAFVTATSGDLTRDLGVAAEQLEREIAAITMNIGASEARIGLANESIQSLDRSGALCPTCQRPLSDDERSDAQAAHREALAASQAELANANERLVELRARAASLGTVLAEIERLGPEPAPAPVSPVDPVAADEALALVSTQVAELQQAATERRGALAEVEKTIAALAANAAEEAERHRAIRREAVAQLTSDTMRRTVDALMAEWVEPVATEVARRWKQVFGDRGTLRLSPKGVISMERGGHVIDFPQFSPGEQVVSMLALRFLTVAASTTSPFMLLDEPMESLDPPNRRLIASVLTGADRPVEQLIITTYEEPLVRRIHAALPEIAIHVIE